MMGIKGITGDWARAGSPNKMQKGSPKFDNDRFRCALTYLEMWSGRRMPSVTMNDIMQLVLKGVPVAAYLAGDIFEGRGNNEMAYQVYNAIAFDNDPHGLKCYADKLFTGRGVEKDIVENLVEEAINLLEQYALAAIQYLIDFQESDHEYEYNLEDIISEIKHRIYDIAREDKSVNVSAPC